MNIPPYFAHLPMLIPKGDDAGKICIRFLNLEKEPNAKKIHKLVLSNNEVKQMITHLLYSLDTIDELPLDKKCVLNQACYKNHPGSSTCQIPSESKATELTRG